MKKTIRIAQLVLGIVFIFSGFVKAVDPLGTQYKLIDYFNVLHIGGLYNLALPLAILLISVELLIGIMFLFNLLPKTGLWLATILLAVFTPLTLFLAIKNPILDCGCFGDALHLTNWQTFWKNIIFDLIIIFLWINHQSLTSNLKKRTQLISTFLALLLIILFQAYNLLFLPIIDFRPYKVGVNIRQALSERHKTTEYKSVLVYKNMKTGEVKEFTEENIPWQDTNWVWQETKTVVVREGQDNGIHDFFLFNQEQQDITDSLLSIKQPVLLIISYNLKKANSTGLEKAVKLADRFTKKYYPIAYLVTGSTEKDIRALTDRINCYCMEVLTGDETMLKTIIRSNPGIVILQDGKIIGKYSFLTNPEKILNSITEE